MLRSRLFNVRLGLVITALVMFVVTMPDVAALGPDSQGLLVQVLCRISIAVLCCVALFLSLMKWFPPHMSAITSAVYLCVGVAAPFSYSEMLDSGNVQGTLSTGIMLLFYSLVGNVSGLNFKDVVVVNVGTLTAWVLMFCTQPNANFWDNGWSTNATASASTDKGTDSGVFFYLFLWLSLAVLANMMSCRYQETYTRRKYVLMQRLKQETAKTDEFLYRMLPEAVVAQMKQSIQVADEFEDVFILTSDVVNFTKMSAASQPKDVVRVLSQLFSAFDTMSEAMGVYKVQTIGDAYIAVTGMVQPHRSHDDGEEAAVPTARRQKNNAVALASFALAMLEEIANVEVPPGVPPLNMRIGLHVGRVVAGVVGTKKFRYDIWGKDVMTATLMESHGVPGEVCVSESLLKYLDGAFEFKKNPLHEIVELPHSKAADGHEGAIGSYQLVRRTADGDLAPPIVKPPST